MISSCGYTPVTQPGWSFLYSAKEKVPIGVVCVLWASMFTFSKALMGNKYHLEIVLRHLWAIGSWLLFLPSQASNICKAFSPCPFCLCYLFLLLISYLWFWSWFMWGYIYLFPWRKILSYYHGAENGKREAAEKTAWKISSLLLLLVFVIGCLWLAV